jgi:hypothetical protein
MRKPKKVHVFELFKLVPCVNPQTGEVWPHTAITIKFYPDAYRVIECGVYTKKEKYPPRVDQSIAMRAAREAFTSDGFTVKETRCEILLDSLAADEIWDAIYGR